MRHASNYEAINCMLKVDIRHFALHIWFLQFCAGFNSADGANRVCISDMIGSIDGGHAIRRFYFSSMLVVAPVSITHPCAGISTLYLCSPSNSLIWNHNLTIRVFIFCFPGTITVWNGLNEYARRHLCHVKRGMNCPR